MPDIKTREVDEMDEIKKILEMLLEAIGIIESPEEKAKALQASHDAIHAQAQVNGTALHANADRDEVPDTQAPVETKEAEPEAPTSEPQAEAPTV